MKMKAVFNLGNFPLVVERTKDGIYLISLNLTASLVNAPIERLIAFLRDQEITDREGSISLIEAAKFWMFEAMTGNINAQALAIASMIECVERRTNNLLDNHE